MTDRAARRKYWNRNRDFYYMLLPVVGFYLLFRYGPMWGVLMAFQDYNIFKGIPGSRWVGLEVFREVLGNQGFWRAFGNTLRLNLLDLLVGFPAPILFALLLNEVTSEGMKRTFQSISYLPHFVSWVVVYGLVVDLFGGDTGLFNLLLGRLGLGQTGFLTQPSWWLAVYVGSSVWKDVGWGAILYLSALTAIDPQLYEACSMDGAGRFKQTLHVTLPGISATICILLILRVGHMLTTGFEAPFLMGNGMVSNVSRVLAVYIYEVGVVGARYSYTTAAGVFLSLGNLILLLLADWGTKRLGGTGFFGGSGA